MLMLEGFVLASDVSFATNDQEFTKEIPLLHFSQ